MGALSRSSRRCSGRQPVFIFGRKPVQHFQFIKELDGMRAHRLSLPGVHSKSLGRRDHTLPALLLELLVAGSARVLRR